MPRYDFLRFKKLRFYFAWPFAIFLAFAAKTTNLGFLVGVPLVVAGETLRIWSQGCIEKRTRLATSGPYAHMRNPLYLSNFLIGLGFVSVFSNLWIFLIYLLGFFILYIGTIREEEKFLLKEYGLGYQDYCGNVPRFFPSLKPYPNRSHQPFQWKLVWQHGEHVTFLTILILLMGLFLRQEWYQAEKGFYSDYLFLFWVVVATSLALLSAVIHRKIK